MGLPKSTDPFQFLISTLWSTKSGYNCGLKMGEDVGFSIFALLKMPHWADLSMCSAGVLCYKCCAPCRWNVPSCRIGFQKSEKSVNCLDLVIFVCWILRKHQSNRGLSRVSTSSFTWMVSTEGNSFRIRLQNVDHTFPFWGRNTAMEEMPMYKRPTRAIFVLNLQQTDHDTRSWKNLLVGHKGYPAATSPIVAGHW